MSIKNIIREVSPESTDLSPYFDDDGLTEASGDYCNDLFIVALSENCGFNEKEYNRIRSELENLLDMYIDIVSHSNYAQYQSVGAMLLDYGLINNIHNTKRIMDFAELFADCCKHPQSPYANYHDNFTAHTEEKIAEYLTLKTRKQWDVDDAYGYCQGDYVKILYCPERHIDGVKQYGEVWLGAAKEFYTIELNENGEEGYTCYGYIVADCQARSDEDYKKIVCEWACLNEEETRLEMIENEYTVRKYEYRIA